MLRYLEALNLSISISIYFILTFHCTCEKNIQLFNPLYLYDDLHDRLLCRLQAASEPNYIYFIDNRIKKD